MPWARPWLACPTSGPRPPEHRVHCPMTFGPTSTTSFPTLLADRRTRRRAHQRHHNGHDQRPNRTVITRSDPRSAREPAASPTPPRRSGTHLQRCPGPAVGSPETASAVVAVPADTERFVYISCGTWRLQECLRCWDTELEPLLKEAEHTRGLLFDPDNQVFLPPGGMPARIPAVVRHDHDEAGGATSPGERRSTDRTSHVHWLGSSSSASTVRRYSGWLRSINLAKCTGTG
ncbi:hypothetical protein KIPE111705_06955 [Kibdelosporangium persicum]